MNYLLDTSVLSEFLKKTPNEDVIRWFRDSDERRHHVSALTVGEIQKGISKLSASRRKADLKVWFDHVITRYEDRILPFGVETARIWGDTLAALERRGRCLPLVDSLIAATALEHDLTIVTCNEDDFTPTGAKVLNLWH